MVCLAQPHIPGTSLVSKCGKDSNGSEANGPPGGPCALGDFIGALVVLHDEVVVSPLSSFSRFNSFTIAFPNLKHTKRVSHSSSFQYDVLRIDIGFVPENMCIRSMFLWSASILAPWLTTLLVMDTIKAAARGPPGAKNKL